MAQRKNNKKEEELAQRSLGLQSKRNSLTTKGKKTKEDRRD